MFFSIFFFLIAMLTVSILILLLIFRTDYPKSKGQLGEKIVSNALQNLNNKKYIIINDIFVPKENGMLAQIDHIVISEKAIFVIETKNYSGLITGSETDQYWNQYLKYKKSKFYNPIWQNYGHIKTLEFYLGEQFQEKNVYSIIVFGNQAELKLKDYFENGAVVNIRNLLSTINAFEESSGYSHFNLQEIKLKLSKLKLLDKDKERKKRIEDLHVQVIKQDLQLQKAKVQNDICPRCGNKLVTRKSMNGEFKGCSQFPKCRFTA